MSSASIMNAIRQKEQELAQEERRLQKLREKYDAIVEFAGNIDRSAAVFAESITKRRRRVSLVAEMGARVRAAKAYANKAGNVLSGQDYRSTSGRIDELIHTLFGEKRKVLQEIDDCKSRISRLEAEIRTLQAQYRQAVNEERRREDEARRQAAAENR